MAGPERAVATKTYTTSLLALTILAGRVVGDAPAQIADQLLPALDAQRRVLTQFDPQSLPAEWRQAGPITFVGRGPSYATALAGSLLFKETARLSADALSSAQFRHGPLEIAGPGHRAVICAGPGATFAYDMRLADELHACGSEVWLIGPVQTTRRYPTLALPQLGFAPLAEIIPLQLAARALTLACGLVPGEFARIGKVTDSE
jgi:glucosamine--fructose-6-phosphate aminotransferase (isomerizing)